MQMSGVQPSGENLHYRHSNNSTRQTAGDPPPMEREASGGGFAVEIGTLGERHVDLDEDALTGTLLGGVDHVDDVPRRDVGQAAGASRIVQRMTGLGHVGDAVFQLHEHVGAVIEAETVAGAQVLIDPDAHGGRNGTAPCLHWLGRD